MNNIKEKLAALQKKYEESPFDTFRMTLDENTQEITEKLVDELDRILDELIDVHNGVLESRTFTSEPEEKKEMINIGGYEFINNIDSKAIEDLANLSYLDFDSEEDRIKYIEEQNERFKDLFKEIGAEPIDPNYKFHYQKINKRSNVYSEGLRDSIKDALKNDEETKVSLLPQEELLKRLEDSSKRHLKRLKDL